MKKIFTLLVSIFVVTMAMAQVPTGVIMKATVAPEIDGVVDAVWADANTYNIDLPYKTEVPTLAEGGASTWKALWSEEGIYILLTANDDTWYPWYVGGGAEGDSWQFDKPEIYFDVNYVIAAGGGASGGAGHIQVAPAPAQDKEDGTPTTLDNGVIYSFLVDGTKYIAEYFVPLSILTDKDGAQIDLTNTMGFDVTLIDRDGEAARNRAVWANATVDESWNNMDGVGLVTFDGSEPPVYVEGVTISGGTTITENGGTLQLVAAVTPEDATSKTVKWSVANGTGKATIDSNGLLTAISDGTVTVTAAALDAAQAQATVDVVISGQQLTQKTVWNNLNLIKNWNFDTDITSWGNWTDPDNYADQVEAVVEDGVVVMGPHLATDGAAWHYQLNQNNLQAVMEVPYVLAFKAWASADAPAVVDFEDTSGNGYRRYGVSTDEGNVDGRSEWNFNLTSEPQWFVFHVTFDEILANTDQKVQFMLSLSNETIYLDSLILVEQEVYESLATLPTANKALDSEISRVYPNPVSNGILTVDLTSVNSKVSIYNAVGQKLMEKTAKGNSVKFDVADLRSGMYFVRTSEGSIQKFIKK